ncbi:MULTISPECIES: HDOD domain-containing protein [unclassified Undibacterium]|uniref:HDOD domain-containing protein n=1 Tax=unclassified Undibacterium TaxID=2630295 RepID=UPI002AC934F0|nr:MULTISPECIES: HDOD domain-containing protein [unclassified Undibacterium]MEB0139047.1 HDOD domain-containing protein [Undibacterium sp. CCC2.1]MEB0172996.1 HDOD domain-containing protein [Undibacterium sp. CCC1.1]MEB0177961.1 HDOD domain-containing protein [Undibacterium sp. CCC3.4]MEB0215914.1 HDOD domain-containing protein [Undibacterium sp. 5I2]WPX42115.1 HDOD domain-containing protein [Undibacterium sp. CCC3.4]
MKIDTLFQQQNALPSIPKVVQEVIDSFNNDSVSIDEVARKLSADLVLSAKLLRLANSSYYHASRSIGTVDDAVLMLGFMTVRTLVISSGLTGGFKSMPGVDLKRFWRYSLYTAVVSKWLAKQVRGNSDFAFTVGLMHAIGQLVMHAGMPEQMLQIDKIAGPLDARRSDVEKTSFGYDFYDVGAELAKRWRFPEAFSVAIEACAEPLQHASLDIPAAIVHLAAWRARAEESAYTPEECAATFPTEVAQKIGIKPELMLEQMPPLSELSAGLEDLLN